MFTVYSSSVALLEIVASRCCLPFHSYLSEVGGDGSVLGGLELEIAVLQGARPARFFFWASASVGSRCPYEDSTLQAVLFLQALYGFVVHDFNYEGMLAYREAARSAVVLASSLGRVVSPISCFPVSGNLDSTAAVIQLQILCNQLMSSLYNI
ncbi:unnamed protein product [Alopecurus aequalis]